MSRSNVVAYQNGRPSLVVPDEHWAAFQALEVDAYRPVGHALIVPGEEGRVFALAEFCPEEGLAVWTPEIAVDPEVDAHDAKKIALRAADPEFFAAEFGANWKSRAEVRAQKAADDARNEAERLAAAEAKRLADEAAAAAAAP